MPVAGAVECPFLELGSFGTPGSRCDFAGPPEPGGEMRNEPILGAVVRGIVLFTGDWRRQAG